MHANDEWINEISEGEMSLLSKSAYTANKKYLAN